MLKGIFMLEKLAAVADFADRNGQYAIANDATNIIKEAQLWDALRTLFDPEHTPGVDRNTPFWKRLSKGWSRGRMDRHLGLVLAIMTERTKLNKKIENMIAPVKEFQEQVAAFYEKLRSGNMTSDNLRDESRGLQGALKDTLRLITGKELRQILKMKERLEAQQLVAAEKIKGLDEETKNNLMAVLKGESLPGSKPAEEATRQEQLPGEAPVDAMKRWLRNQKVPRMAYNQGASTKAGAHQFREFMDLYGFHPKAITDRFSDVDLQAEGFARFPKAFSELLRHAQAILDYDAQRLIHEQRAKNVPGAAAAAPAPEPPMPEIKKEVAQEEKETSAPASAAPPATTVVAPAAHAGAPELIPLLEKPPAPAPRKERDVELAQKVKETTPRRKRPGGPLRERPIATAPEEKTPRPTSSSVDDLPLAFSTATRTERQITRLGRMQYLRKLAVDLDEESTAEDFIQQYDVRRRGNETIGDSPEDIMNIGDRETFDENIHVDPDEIEYYKGREPDDGDWGENMDIENARYPREYPHIPYSELTPEDDDWAPPRREPVLEPATKQEKLEQLGAQLRAVTRTLENFRYSRDNEIGDYYHTSGLEAKKKALIKQIKDLSGLPENWIRTSSLGKTFNAPIGFTEVSKLGGREPSTIGEYESQGLTGAEPGTWAQNNGTLALVASSGDIYVWIPKSDPSAPRAVPYDKAIRLLNEAGFKKGNFYVPFSNR